MVTVRVGVRVRVRVRVLFWRMLEVQMTYRLFRKMDGEFGKRVRVRVLFWRMLEHTWFT